jgi:hypothetical protein
MKACKSGRDWVQRQIKKGKSTKEILESCNNDNYLFWLYDTMLILDWDKYFSFKTKHKMYSMDYYGKEYKALRIEFMHKTVKYKDFHTAAIKFLKRNKAGEFHV